MNYDWYKLFNLLEWQAEGLVQRSLTVDLEGRDRMTFLINQGNTTSVAFDDKFLPIAFLDQNPYVHEGAAIYRDANDDIFVGFEADE